MYDITDEIPRVKSLAEFKKKIRPLYVIDEYASSKERYIEFKKEITDLCIGSFHSKKMMLHPIAFKFYKDDRESYQLTLRSFLYNVYLWYPMVELKGLRVFGRESIMYPENIPHVNDEIYRISLVPMIENSVDRIHVQTYASDIVYDLSSISVYFGLIMGLHFEDRDVFHMYDTYGTLLHPRDYSEMQPNEIEEANKESEAELMRLIRADIGNPLRQVVLGGNPLKVKQLREMLISVSLRPTLDGDVVTIPINKGLIMGALMSPSDVYIDALAARYPQLVNNKDMGTVGYFVKALNILSKTLEVSRVVLDCGSTHLVEYEVKSDYHLYLLDGKYMDDGHDDFHMINYAKDKHLIGKKIRARSAVTCCCGENEVCARCLGNIINLNWDIAEGFATFITEEWSKVVEQSHLSTKHLIHPIPEVITFTDSFDLWFNLRGDEIYLKTDLPRKELAIVIDPEDIYKVEEFDTDTTFNNYIDSGKFFVENLKTGDRVEVASKNNKKIFIRTDTNDVMSSDGRILMKDLAEDSPVFEISIENNDARKPFTEIMQLIDLENKPIEDTSIVGMSQRLHDLFAMTKMNLSVAAFEVMLNRICRVPGDVRRRPNFAKRELPEYHFYSLGKCIEENGSPTVGMIYEQLQRQLLRITLEDRNDSSFIDPFFEELVCMQPILSQRDAIERGYTEED